MFPKPIILVPCLLRAFTHLFLVFPILNSEDQTSQRLVSALKYHAHRARAMATTASHRLSGCTRALELLTEGLTPSGHRLRGVGAIDYQFIILHSLLS